ncbi:uncharacterized protein [Clytia hemisphaerica]|uniref:uncharacterized protein n=1 Tax=Clytia hemisphaerica TaxID=252671 RepID=UPI0034D3FDA4
MKTLLEESNTKHKAETKALEDKLQALQEEFDASRAKTKTKKRRKIENGASDFIHRTYKSLFPTVDDGWNVHQGYKSQHNSRVTLQIHNQININKHHFANESIKDGIYRYYEHLCRKSRETDDDVARNRRNGRRKRLFDKRSSIEMDGEIEEYWNHLASPLVMSDIETDDEQDGHKTFRRPKWRATIFNNLIDRIDQSLGIRRLYSETPSSRHVFVEKLKPEILAENENIEDENTEPAVTNGDGFQALESD